jgi:hypothetical protein
MQISRNVIMDLLPVYLAGEASEDTRVLIEEYLQTDQALARMVAESDKTPFTVNVSTPINKETEMATLEKTQAEVRRTIIVGIAAATVGLVIVTVAPLLVTAVAVYLMFMR